MAVMREHSLRVETYSIDESFLLLDGLSQLRPDMTTTGHEYRAQGADLNWPAGGRGDWPHDDPGPAREPPNQEATSMQRGVRSSVHGARRGQPALSVVTTG